MIQKFLAMFLAVMSIFSIFAKEKSSQHEELNKRKVVDLNQASKKSIASSWLALPDTCKARNFNAKPSITDRKIHSLEVKNIFQSLG